MLSLPTLSLRTFAFKTTMTLTLTFATKPSAPQLFKKKLKTFYFSQAFDAI